MSEEVVVIDYAVQQTPDPADRLRVGTLRYTLGGLMWLFVWLLWGDFCYTVMEQVNWNILPLTLKQMDAPVWALPIVYTTIPAIINLLCNPIISTWSDRHRGRWGRRIPFLLFSAPFLSASLVAMAFTPEISRWMHGWLGPVGGFSMVGVSVFTLGLLVATFKVFDMFLNTAFWYLFNDVVPEAFLGRFMGIFRVVGCLAAALFMHFAYKHSVTHMRAIYLVAAAVYFVGFSLMCLFVKEGKYPPVPPPPASHGRLQRLWKSVRAYCAECLSHRIYWYFFLHGMFFSLSTAIGVYQTNLNLALGISLEQWGDLNGVIQVVILLLAYPAGVLVDRIHPMRILWYMEILLLIIAPLNFVWLYSDFVGQGGRAFHIMIGLQAIDLPISLLYSAAGMPLMMRMLPKDRFGQFGSFNAVCCAIMTIIGSAGAAKFMACMQQRFPDAIWGKDFCYRLMPVWRVPCLVIAIVILWLMFREWKRLGGDHGYRPPDSGQDAAPGAEVAPQAAVAG